MPDMYDMYKQHSFYVRHVPSLSNGRGVKVVCLNVENIWEEVQIDF